MNVNSPTYDIIIKLLALENPNLDDLLSIRKSVSQAHGLAHMPGNAEIIKSYFELIQSHKQGVEDNPNDSDYSLFVRRKDVETLLKKRAIRSQSGIVPVQVLTKPFWCPGECIFCPNDVTMPKSYINTEPGAQRALLNNFDPYKQVYNRLLSLTLTGHETDKIEMIVLGGTRDVYPKNYKVEFIKWLYDACNNFDQFFDSYICGKGENEENKEHNNMSTGSRSFNSDAITKDFSYPKTIAESIKINENADCRIIWLTIETRPEYVTDENCQLRRELGVTRIEMGIQNMFDDVLDANKRGHSVEQCRTAMYKLRQYAFKISIHLMPGLYKSTIEKDIETFRIAFADPAFCPDELKFYPTAVIPNTELFNLYKKWEYKTLTMEENKMIIKKVLKEYIPPYTRIKRLIRDIPAEETVWTEYVTNLRQLVENELQKEVKWFSDEERTKYYNKLYPNLQEVRNKEDLQDSIKKLLKTYQSSNLVTSQPSNLVTFISSGTKLNLSDYRNFVSFDTRSREIRNNLKSTEVFPIVRCYPTTNGLQLFISFEDELGYLYGFTRLQLGSIEDEIEYEGLGKWTALIRELHVYWQLAKINYEDTTKTQHQWLWSQLMELSEQISRYCWYSKISVISWVGVRKYYEKLGYILEGTYMIKDL